MDEKIDKERKALQKLFDQSRLLKEGGKVSGQNMSLKEFMGQKKAEYELLQVQVDAEDKEVKRIEEELD